jgi:FlaA1/EpsC-like NDP-sugar epimerase
MKHVVMCEDFPIEAVQTNISGTQNVVDQALKHKVAKLITISTDKAAYAVNVLGASKFIGERITLNANEMCGENHAFSCVRFGNVTNSRGSVIPVFVDNLLNRKPIQVTDREVTRFIMRISDAVRLIMKATGHARGGEIFILKMRAFRLGDLVDVMVERIAPRLKISGEQIEFSATGLTKGEKLHEDLINDNEGSGLYELEDMYVVFPGDRAASRYPSAKKAHLAGYISRDVALLSKDELEEIVLEYVLRPSASPLSG